MHYLHRAGIQQLKRDARHTEHTHLPPELLQIDTTLVIDHNRPEQPY